MVFQIKKSEVHHLGFFYLIYFYPTLLLELLLLPPPLLLLLLVLVVGDDNFFNKSYQNDEPCETAAAVIPNPTALKSTNQTQPI